MAALRTLRTRRAGTRRPLGAAAVAVAAALLLAGCTPDPAGPSTPPATAPGSDGPSESDPGETAGPPATEPTAEIIPFAIDCDALLTLDDVYAFNPNFGAAPDFAPATESAQGAVAIGGTACGWLNQTSGELIEVGVATPDEVSAESLKNAAAVGSSAVPTYGAPPLEGYFAPSGSGGTAQVFSGPYWVSLSSTAFFEPGDAAPLVEAILRNLPPA